MAAETIWETGVLKAVLHPVGKSGDNGKVRYRYGNFELLQWASQLGGLVEQYVVPTGIANYDGREFSVSRQDIEIGREFGYYDGQALVIELHAGDGSDTLPGLHSFGIF